MISLARYRAKSADPETRGKLRRKISDGTLVGSFAEVSIEVVVALWSGEERSRCGGIYLLAVVEMEGELDTDHKFDRLLNRSTF